MHDVLKSVQQYQNLIQALHLQPSTKSRNYLELQDDVAWASLISFIVFSIIALLVFFYMRKREASAQEKKNLVAAENEKLHGHIVLTLEEQVD